MKLKNKLITSAVTLLTAISIAAPSAVYAAKGDQGVDWSRWQGTNGVFGYPSDKFGISQIGGYGSLGLYDQWTYKTQVASLIAAGKRAHTYIWWQNIDNTNLAKRVLDYFLPKVQTPKGSIVALDYESGSSNTATLLWALDYIKAAGYTPMLYGYKNFLVNHTDLAQIARRYQLWLAEYPDYSVTTSPNYNYFPSFDSIGIFQFTSTYRAGGLDGNVDLTGITDNGYGGNITTGGGKVIVKPSTSTPAINAGQQANSTPKRDIKAGDTVKVNFGTTRWANGIGMPSWVQGKTYTVLQVSGSNLLLGGIMSWISRGNVELLGTSNAPSPSYGSTYVVRYGDSWWSIAHKYGLSMYSLASNNGKSIYSVLHPRDVLNVSGGLSGGIFGGFSGNSYYTVRYGDSWWSIAHKYGISMYTLAAKNGKSIYSMIHPNQRLLIR